MKRLTGVGFDDFTCIRDWCYLLFIAYPNTSVSHIRTDCTRRKVISCIKERRPRRSTYHGPPFPFHMEDPLHTYFSSIGQQKTAFFFVELHGAGI